MYPRMLGTALGRLLLLIFGLAPLPAMASLPTGPGTNILTSVAASPDSVSGFRWMAALITTKTAVRGRSRSAARRSSTACRFAEASPPYPARKATGSSPTLEQFVPEACTAHQVLLSA